MRVVTWAEPVLRAIEDLEVPLHGNALIFQGEVNWLVVLVVGPTAREILQQFKRYNAVWLWVLDLLAGKSK